MRPALARAHSRDAQRLQAHSAGRQLCAGALPRDRDPDGGYEGFSRTRSRCFSVAAPVVAQWYLDEAQSVVRDGRAAGLARGGAEGIGRKEAMKAAIFRG